MAIISNGGDVYLCIFFHDYLRDFFRLPLTVMSIGERGLNISYARRVSLVFILKIRVINDPVSYGLTMGLIH